MSQDTAAECNIARVRKAWRTHRQVQVPWYAQLAYGTYHTTTTLAFGLMQLAAHTRSDDDRQLVSQLTRASIHRREDLDFLALYG